MEEWQTYFTDTSYMAALPLADTGGGQKRIIGTATLLMTGVFITAKHLVEQYVKDHEKIDIADSAWEPQDISVNFNLEALQILKDLGLVVWHITKVHIIPNSDLAILVADRCSGTKAEEIAELGIKAQINLHMPPIGSRIVSLGYPKSKNAKHKNGAPSRHKVRMRTSEGVVEDLHTAETKWSPRFQTNAPVDGGMSGGPVFNEQGLLCGVNFTGLEPTEEHPFYTSFAIPLHTAFMSRLSLNLNGKPTVASLLELARQGYIDVLGLEHFVVRGSDTLWDSRNIKCPSCTLSPTH